MKDDGTGELGLEGGDERQTVGHSCGAWWDNEQRKRDGRQRRLCVFN